MALLILGDVPSKCKRVASCVEPVARTFHSAVSQEAFKRDMAEISAGSGAAGHLPILHLVVSQ